MLKGFREFILKGNVVELATAVIIGAAFTAIVTAFTEKIIQPLINAIPIGTDRAQGLGFQVTDNANTFVNIGAVITAALNFLIVAAVVYFIIVLPYNKLAAFVGFDRDAAEATEVALLTEIRNILDPKAAGRNEAAASVGAAAGAAASPATSVFEKGPDFSSGPANPSPLGRGPAGPPPQSGPIPPVGPPPQSGPFQAGGPQAYAPRPDGPAVQPSRDFGGPPSGAIPLPTERFQSGPSVQPSQPQGPPPAAPPGSGYAPPNPAPGPGQGGYPPPPGNYPQGQGNSAPPNFPPSGGFPAQPNDPDAPGRHSR